MRFQQRFNELFSEAWDRFNDLLRACPHHGFFELHQLDTFYNALNINDQDSLNSATGGNFLDKMLADCLKIIKSKSKVCQTRAKAVVAKVSSNSSTPVVSADVAELKDMLLNRIVLPAVVITRTKIVPRPAETFIKTTSKSMCHKPQQPITVKETPVSALRCPTPSDDPIISTTSPTLTPFGDSDFLLFEEADAFLGLEDDPDSPELDPSYYDLEGDILSLKAILNSDPSPPLTNHEQSVPSFKEELKAWNEYYCFLDDFSGYFQIPIDSCDQEKTTFTCPYGTFAYRRMPFSLCNASGTFQRCMLAIFYDMVEKTMEVFMDDFLAFGNSFENCLSRLDNMLQ
nr:reverse transcriptase domain-containing protein [Tanacetum cinerariifolium]